MTAKSERNDWFGLQRKDCGRTDEEDGHTEEEVKGKLEKPEKRR
jgi:hypothetical protein